jgi:glycosyltransferase involved in cell wall biosynthesis
MLSFPFLNTRLHAIGTLVKIVIISNLLAAWITSTYSLSQFLVALSLLIGFALLLIYVYTKLPTTLRPLGLALPTAVIVQSFLIPISLLVAISLSINDFSIVASSLLGSLIVTCLTLQPMMNTRKILRIFYQVFLGASIWPADDEYSAYIWHSKGTRDLVSLQASYGQLDFDGIRELVLGSDVLKIKRGVAYIGINGKEIESKWLMNLARLLALQPIDKEDLTLSLKIYEMVWESKGSSAFLIKRSQVTQQHSKVFLDLLIYFDRIDKWHYILKRLKPLSKHRLITSIDRWHPKLSVSESHQNRWLSEFNKEFRASNLEELEIENFQDSLIDSINCKPKRLVDGPLVTVIVSAYNPGPELLTSLKSICNQTWSNLEIILVDDSSTDVDFIKIGATLDPRITVLSQSTNSGTYSARNLAIYNSKGKYIATHDSDDWMHPQRIERHVLPMIADSNLMGTISRALRTTPDLLLSHLGFSPFRQNASSLTFRRALIDEIGYFDTVRKGADSEFDARINSKYPGSIHLVGIEPLSIIRMGHDSLSRSEFKPMWFHPARQAYRSSYSRWHKKSERLGVTPFLNINEINRKFSAPSRFTDFSSSNHYDVIYASSFTVQDNSTIDNHIHDLKRLIEKGQRVGILQLRPLQIDRPLDSEVQDMLNDGSISLVMWDEIATADYLLIRKARPFQIQPVLPWNIKAKHTIVSTQEDLSTQPIAEIAPRGTYLEHFLHPSKKEFNIDLVSKNMGNLGLQPKWIPTSEWQGIQLNQLDIETFSGMKNWNIEEFISKIIAATDRSKG